MRLCNNERWETRLKVSEKKYVHKKDSEHRLYMFTNDLFLIPG